MPRDINISVDTSTLNLAARGETTTSFSVDFPTPIILGSMNWFLSFTKLATFKSFHTISPIFPNHQYIVTNTLTSVVTTITIPSGHYSFQDFNAVYNAQVPVGGPTFSVNNNTGKFTLTVPANYQIQMTAHSAYNFGLLGGVKNDPSPNIYPTGTFTSPNVPQWSNGITSFLLSCDLTSSSTLNGKQGNVIAQFSTDGIGTFEPVVYEPFNRNFFQVNKKEITKITFRITDQSGRSVDFQGEHFTISMILRQIN